MGPSRSGDAGERGATLVELMVALVVLGLALGVIYGALIQMTRLLARTTAVSVANQQTEVAVAEVDRDIRSGNVLYDPSTLNDPAAGIYPGMALLLYTQNNAPQAPVPNRCVEWRVDRQLLQTRYWSPAWRSDGIVSPWRTVAAGIVNATVSPQVSAFSLPGAAYGGRLVSVDLLAASAPGATPSQLQVSVTGRNTLYGYPQTVCASIPPSS